MEILSLKEESNTADARRAQNTVKTVPNTEILSSYNDGFSSENGPTHSITDILSWKKKEKKRSDGVS